MTDYTELARRLREAPAERGDSLMETIRQRNERMYEMAERVAAYWSQEKEK